MKIWYHKTTIGAGAALCEKKNLKPFSQQINEILDKTTEQV